MCINLRYDETPSHETDTDNPVRTKGRREKVGCVLYCMLETGANGGTLEGTGERTCRKTVLFFSSRGWDQQEDKQLLVQGPLVSGEVANGPRYGSITAAATRIYVLCFPCRR